MFMYINIYVSIHIILYRLTTTFTTMFMAVLVFLLMTSTAAAQPDQTVGPCAVPLQRCANYLSPTTRPPSSCCDTLRDMMMSQKPCLCGLYRNPSIWMAVNMTEAMTLPVRCHIPTTASPSEFCKGVNSFGTGSRSKSNSAVKITGTLFVSALLMLLTYEIISSW